MILWLGIGLPAAAQERLTPTEFLDFVAPRTATFVTFPGGRLVGIEQFLSRDRTVWARANGTCAFGQITTDETQICFEYDDDVPGVRHCWVPYLQDARLLVVSASTPGSMQEVTEISDTPVTCTEMPLS